MCIVPRIVLDIVLVNVQLPYNSHSLRDSQLFSSTGVGAKQVPEI